MEGQPKPTRHSQIFWAGFAVGRRTPLVPLFGDEDTARGGVTSRQILDCLQENLATIAEPGYFFVQDNASTHMTRIVQPWLTEWARDHGIYLVAWPPYSPDLNPIENFWKLLNEQIIKLHPELSVMSKSNYAIRMLCEAANEAWELFEDSLLEKLAFSMQLLSALMAGMRNTKVTQMKYDA